MKHYLHANEANVYRKPTVPDRAEVDDMLGSASYDSSGRIPPP